MPSIFRDDIITQPIRVYPGDRSSGEVMEACTKIVKTAQWNSGSWEDVTGSVIVEAPVSLTVNGEIWTTFLCTPIHLDSLALGFLYNENFIQGSADVVDTRVCPTGENIDVWTSHAIERPTTWRRSTDCAGGISAQNQASPQPKAELCEARLRADQIGPLIERFLDTQGLYRQGGGVHASALSDGQEILIFAEDVGQPNTLDKISGMCLLQKVFPAQRVILTTGRVTSEMVQKAARLQASFVITRGSPSSLSVEIAETLGITLIGRAHLDRYTIYAHPERITR
jgi:FdhD protein